MAWELLRRRWIGFAVLLSFLACVFAALPPSVPEGAGDARDSSSGFGIDLGFTSKSRIAVARNISDTQAVEYVGAGDTGEDFGWTSPQILVILRALIAQAEAETGLEVKQVVVTLPTTTFLDGSERLRQQAALQEAADVLGLKILRFLNRHAANFLAYGTDEWDDEDQYVLMVDEGMRATTISILAVEDNIFDLRATSTHGSSRSALTALDALFLEANITRTQVVDLWIIGPPASRSQLRTKLKDFYERPLNEHQLLVGDPEKAAVYGAALQARTLAPQERDDWYIPVMIMMRPIGIDVNGETIVLLPGWSVLPIARSTICSFAASNRNEGATIKVYEGRRRRTIENTLLAAFNLDSGAESINVTMSMDLEERLTVSATAVGTDKTVQIQIEPPWPSREAWYLRTGSDTENELFDTSPEREANIRAGLTFDPAFKEPYFVNFSAEEETGDSTTIGRSGGEL